jgi:hypothetical protein
MSNFFTSPTRGQPRKSSFFSSASPYDTEKVQRSITNAQTRIEDAGYKKEDADSRNWFEKATNLPEKQNWFFDAMELIGRPGQAIMNPINKSIKGEEQNILSSMAKGFSGKERVRGTDVAENLGVENKAGKFALGLGLDIALDPITFVPGGAIVKGVKAASRPIGKGVNASYNALENLSPKLKQIREDTVQPAAESAKDKLGYMFSPDYKATETLTGGQSDDLLKAFNQTEKQRRYLQEEHTNKLIDTAKTTGLEAGTDVGRVMEAPLRQFENAKAYLLPGGSKQTENKQDVFDAIQTNREMVRSMGKSVNATDREYQKAISETASQLEKTENQIRRLYFSRENAALRQLHQRKNQPLNMDELAQSKAFSEVSVSPKFNYLLNAREELKKQLGQLRTETKATKEGTIADIHKLTNENGALKDSLRNPITIQKEIPRPQRELSSDPKIRGAAEQLMKSNDEIRQLAEANGIPISELEGYMTHILSKEQREARKKNKVFKVDQGNFGLGQPNKKILNPRKLPGSVEDVNEQLGKKFFEPNAYFATAIGQRRLIDYVQSVGFRKQVLNNPDFAMKYEKGMDVPKNATVIDTNNYKFIKESGDLLENVASKDIGGQYVVTKAAKEKLDRYKNAMTDEGSKAFLNAFDLAQSFWKRAALFSVPYHLRNDVGAKFNNWIGGMDAVDLAKYSAQADKEVFNAMVRGKESDLYKEYRKQGLNESSQAKVEFARRGQEPEKAIEKMVKERTKDTKGKIKDRLNPLRAFDTSQELGIFVDQTNRFAIFKWAVEKKGMGYEDAAKKVAETQFDYTKLTNFERDFMTRGVPFYRWMRNNLPYQIRNFVNDPRKYANLNKARLNAQEAVGIDDQNVPEFMKEGFYMPVSGDGKGSGKMLGFNLPLGDVAKLSEPGKMGIDSLTPLAKLPLELGLNRNFFYNKPIQKFEGQEKQFAGDVGIPIKLAYALEQATGQIGRGLSGIMQKPEEADQDTKFRMPSMGISSVLKDFDADKSKYFESREQLRKLMDLINYIEQQEGTRPRTIKEIRR